MKELLFSINVPSYIWYIVWYLIGLIINWMIIQGLKEEHHKITKENIFDDKNYVLLLSLIPIFALLGPVMMVIVWVVRLKLKFYYKIPSNRDP